MVEQLAHVDQFIQSVMGKYDVYFFIFMFTNLIDIVTGVLSAVITKSFRSSNMAQGIMKKVSTYFILALVLVLVEGFGLPTPLFISTIILYIVTECTSILENLGNFGVTHPAIIERIINIINTNAETIPENNEKEGDDTTNGK